MDEKMEVEDEKTILKIEDDYMKKVSEEVQTRVASWLNDFSNKIKSFDETLEFLLTEEKRRRKLDEIENTTYIVLEMAKLCRAEKKNGKF